MGFRDAITGKVLKEQLFMSEDDADKQSISPTSDTELSYLKQAKHWYLVLAGRFVYEVNPASLTITDVSQSFFKGKQAMNTGIASIKFIYPADGEGFKVANFSVVSKDDEGNKVYHSCSAYGEKSDIPKDFKQGDFVKLFGQLRISIDDNGKEHSNVRILSSKLLKAKEQMKGQDKSQEIAKLKSEIEEREKDLFYADSWEQSGQIRADIEKMKAKLNTLLNSEKGQENGKKSIIGAIKEYQAEDKKKPKESKEKPKETER